MARDLSGVEEPTTYELTRTVPDHEVLIVFVNDDDALDFRDWLADEGWRRFADWERTDGS